MGLHSVCFAEVKQSSPPKSLIDVLAVEIGIDATGYRG